MIEPALRPFFICVAPTEVTYGHVLPTNGTNLEPPFFNFRPLSEMHFLLNPATPVSPDEIRNVVPIKDNWFITLSANKLVNQIAQLTLPYSKHCLVA